MTIRLLAALIAFATVSSAHAAPKEVDSTAATVLALGATPAKISKLMASANSLDITEDARDASSTFVFTAQDCESGIILNCTPMARLTIVATTTHRGEQADTSYKAGDVQVLKSVPPPINFSNAPAAPKTAPNAKGYTCISTINCMPPVSAGAAKYCTDDYSKWAEKNCGGAPEQLQ